MNDEADVREVFQKRAQDMVLTTEHVIAFKVNWLPKAQNLEQLAQV